MSVRLAFAVAAHLEPEILLVDEVLAVGDAEFQRRCLGRMEDLSQSGRTVIFVSHNMQAVAQLCDRALLLDGGRIVNDGPSAEIVADYLQAGHGSGASRVWDELDARQGTSSCDCGPRACSRTTPSPDRSTCASRSGSRSGSPCSSTGSPSSRRSRSSTGRATLRSTRWTPARGGRGRRGRASTSPSPGSPVTFSTRAWSASTSVICSLDGTKFHHRAAESDALSFHVHDPGVGDSARGQFIGQVKGVVRPLLEWSSEER